jgi:hypothetical protein
MAWEARRQIAGGDAEKVGWPRLCKEDIRCMQDAEELLRNAEKWRKANARRRRKEGELRALGELPPIEEEDEEDDEMVTRGGESVREISWIWTMAGTAGTDEELEDGTFWILIWIQGADLEDQKHCVSSGQRRGHAVVSGRRRCGF